MIVYVVFTLFFFGAGINSAVDASGLHKYYGVVYLGYSNRYPPAVATAVTLFRSYSVSPIRIKNVHLNLCIYQQFTQVLMDARPTSAARMTRCLSAVATHVFLGSLTEHVLH